MFRLIPCRNMYGMCVGSPWCPTAYLVSTLESQRDAAAGPLTADVMYYTYHISTDANKWRYKPLMPK